MRPVSLIVGSDGLLGRGLMAGLQCADADVMGTTRRQAEVSDSRCYLDLSKAPGVWESPRPVDLAVICAGVTSLEACRRDPAATSKVNVHGILALAKRLLERGAFLIYLSTNRVFDGSVPFPPSDAPVSPMTEYGRQKAEAEKQLLAMGGRVSVVRLSKVLGGAPPLLSDWIEKLRDSAVIRPFSDMTMAPVSLAFAVRVIAMIAKARLPGITQVSAGKDVTYEQVARHMARRVKAEKGLVQPVEARGGGRHLEDVPAHTTLDTTRMTTELGVAPPDVWETIDSVLSV